MHVLMINMKKMKELLRAKRAFSPVIASLILMLLAVAAGVVVYAYVMGWIGGATKNPETQTGQMSLDSAKAVASTNIITAYIRNIGGKSLTVNRAYVDDTNVTSVTGALTFSPTVVTALTINATSPGLTVNYSYEVKVVCTDGTALVFSVKAE
jgi:FlaG/FlaF family flagellin (archaellin)